LTVCPRVTRLGETVFYVKVGAGALEGVAAEEDLVGAHLPDLGRCPGFTGRLGEVRAVIGQHCVDLVGNGGGKRPEEVACDTAGRLLVQLDEGEFGGPVNRDEEVELALPVRTSAISIWK
jgi:hypothetical protein